MPSRSSTTPSIRCAEPSGRTTTLLAGTRYLWLRNPDNAVRPPAGHLRKPAHCAISRPHVPTGSGWPSRNSTTNPLTDSRRGLPQAMVFLGNPQPAAADHRRRPHRQTPLGRHSALVPQQDRQWSHRGDQQPRPGRQGKGSRLSLNPQPHRHGLSPRRKARSQLALLRSLLPTPNSEEP